MMGRRSIVAWTAIAALLLPCGHTLDAPRSFLRRTDEGGDKASLTDAILAPTEKDSVAADSNDAPTAAAVTRTFKFSGALVGVDDQLRRLVEVATTTAPMSNSTNSTEGETSEDAVIDEIVPQVVEIIVSAVADSLIAEIVTTLGASEDGPLGGAAVEVVNIVVLAVAGSLVTAIVTAILGNPEQRAAIANELDQGRRRRLQFDTLLADIVPQVLEIISSFIVEALVSIISEAVGGILGGAIGGLTEQILSIVFVAVAGAVVAAIVAALFGGGEEIAAFVTNTLGRRLQSKETAVGTTNNTATDVEVEQDTFRLIRLIIIALIVSAILGGGGGGTAPELEALLRNPFPDRSLGENTRHLQSAVDQLRRMQAGPSKVAKKATGAVKKEPKAADAAAPSAKAAPEATSPSTTPQSLAKNETGEVEEETIPEIISSVSSAVIDAVVAYTTQYLIDLILGFLGIPPAVSESQVGNGRLSALLSRLNIDLDAIRANLSNSTAVDTFLEGLNLTDSAPEETGGRALLQAVRKGPLGRVRAPQVRAENPEREPQGDTLIIILLISRVVKLVIGAAIIALIVQAIGGGAEEPPPEGRNEWMSQITSSLDSLLGNSTTLNETAVTESLRDMDARFGLGIGDGDGTVVVSVFLFRILVILISLLAVPIIVVVGFLLALVGICDDDDNSDCDAAVTAALRDTNVRNGFGIGDGDGTVVVSVLLFRIIVFLISLIVVPIIVVIGAILAVFGVCDDNDNDCLEANSLRSRLNLDNLFSGGEILPAGGNFTQLVSSTINDLNITVDTSAINATVLSDQILSVLRTLDFGN